jgi:hypothetical protein
MVEGGSDDAWVGKARTFIISSTVDSQIYARANSAGTKGDTGG